MDRYTPDVQRQNADEWEEGSLVHINWDSESIGSSSEQVTIDLARYKMGHDEVPELESFHTVVNSQLNTGQGQFVVTKGQGDG